MSFTEHEKRTNLCVFCIQDWYFELTVKLFSNPPPKKNLEKKRRKTKNYVSCKLISLADYLQNSILIHKAKAIMIKEIFKLNVKMLH